METSALFGKAALITGASQGLGAELASELAQRGARVVLNAREPSALESVAESIRKRGAEAYAVPGDVGEKSSLYPLIGAATALVGPIDILINNASTLGPTPLRLLLDTECEDFERALAVNLLGPFRLSKIVAGSMAVRGVGTIVNISSDAAVNAYPRWGIYSISKAALDHQARLFASELAEFGVRVFSVDPGEMDTRMHAAALPDTDPQTLERPLHVARKIADMIATNHVANGTRVEASSYGTESPPRTAEAS